MTHVATIENLEIRPLKRAKRALPLFLEAPDSFKQAYEAFGSEIIELNVHTISFQETADFRAVLLAGVYRIYLDKKTCLLSIHSFSRNTARWTPVKDFSLSLLGTVTTWNIIIDRALMHRLMHFAKPSALDFELKKTSRSGRRYSKKEALRQQKLLFENACQFALKMRSGAKFRQRISAAVLARKVWSMLIDRTISKLAYSLFGKNFTLDQYNYCIRNKSILETYASETPTLMPLIGAAIAADKTCKFELNQNLISQIKKKLIKNGLTEVSWRLITRLSISTVRRLPHTLNTLGRDLNHPFFNLVNEDDYSDIPLIHRKEFDCSIYLLNLLANLNQEVTHTFAKWILEDRLIYSFFYYEKTEISREYFQRFIRLANAEANKNKKSSSLKAFIKNDLGLSLDWLFPVDEYGYRPDRGNGGYGADRRVGDGTIRVIQKNATWASIMRLQRHWHLELPEIRRAAAAARAKLDENARLAWEEHNRKLMATAWPSAIDAIEIRGVEIIPLQTGQCLYDEAIEMEHCVDQYMERCVQGYSRIFKVKSPDERATLELIRKTPNQWVVAQIRGWDNEDVSKELNTIAIEMAKQYSKADQIKII